MKSFYVIGLMSGTSLDGVDLVYVKFNKSEEWNFDIINSKTYPYKDSVTKLLTHISKKSLDEIKKIDAELAELKRCKSKALCCGAGGAQMFKESEKGKTEINLERAEEIKKNTSKIVATGCPFCNTMLTDGTKSFEADKQVEVLDIAELIVRAKDL